MSISDSIWLMQIQTEYCEIQFLMTQSSAHICETALRLQRNTLNKHLVLFWYLGGWVSECDRDRWGGPQTLPTEETRQS